MSHLYTESHGNRYRAGRCLSPPGRLKRNLFHASTKECAYTTQGAVSHGEAGSEEERREQEVGLKEKERYEAEARRQEEERRKEKESEEPGEPGRHKTGAEQESLGAASRNGESGKASHVLGVI
ncbi:hypothetical protein NDU88_004290 [Pleurodeles waltl]|uniref:Uncharacterized protein n=1 Tax=Pleurodeles waltl TaxID=8319 RepID=A0AAV7VHU2_PLEWA|nr:hypothetical protein NDU88_004290 [Pleurodeles waltl]